jgi:hypothetical protein
MAQIFFPHNLTPQGFINDFLLAQMHSDSFEDLREYIHHKTFLKETDYKLTSMGPGRTNMFETSDLQKTPRNATGKTEIDTKKMARYVHLLTNMKPHQFAAMVPYIRLRVRFVPIRDKKQQKPLGEKEIIFKTYTGVKDAGSMWAGKTQEDIGKDAGILNLNVSRTFQFMGVSNRFNIDMSFLFRDMATFANGSPITPDIKDGDLTVSEKPGQDYIYLIKRLGKKAGDTRIQEQLILEYGWKFGANTSEDIIGKEDRTLFEEQEKKVLRLQCFRHKFGFNQTGEIKLDVSYTAFPLAVTKTRSENRKNDIFSVSNESLLDQIFAKEKGKGGAYKTFAQIKQKQKLLKRKLKEKQKIVKCNCVPDAEKKKIKDTEEYKKKLNEDIASLRQDLLRHMQYIFFSYFYKHKQLFLTSFESEYAGWSKTDPHKLPAGGPKVKMYMRRFTIGSEADLAPKVFNGNLPSYIKVYDELSGSFDSTAPKDPKRVQEEQDRMPFPYNENNPDIFWKKYNMWALQSVYTLSNIPRDWATKATLYNQYKGTKMGNFTFFPIRALLASIYEFSKDYTNEGDGSSEFYHLPSICLGNIIGNSLGKDYWLNIGDILVEVGVFQRWLYKEFVLINNAAPTLDQFLTSIFEKLIPEILSMRTGHYTSSLRGKIVQNQYSCLPKFRELYKKMHTQKGASLYKVTTTTPQAPSDAAKTATVGPNELLYKDLLLGIKNSGASKEMGEPFLYYYQEPFTAGPDGLKQSRSAFLRRFGKRDLKNRQKDFEAGIYYVYVGQDSGIVKNANFDYINDPYLNTHLARTKLNPQEPYLRYSYKANIDFVGNNLYYGRSAFFAIPVNQFNFQDDSKGDPFGITGYYRIESTTDQISNGQYTTTVNGMNVYSPSRIKNNCDECKEKKEKKKEKLILSYVEHDLIKHMGHSLTTLSDMAAKFNLKPVEEQEETVDEPPQPPPATKP